METKKGEKMDRRVRKTRAQLRAGLARLMQKKNIKEITVKELVDEIDINRSTFYLHYTDIYQMLQSIEGELMEDILEALKEHPLDPGMQETGYSFCRPAVPNSGCQQGYLCGTDGAERRYGFCGKD